MEFKKQVDQLTQQVGSLMQQVGGVTSSVMQVQSEILTLKNIVSQIGQYLQNLDAGAGKRIMALEAHCGIKPEAEVAPQEAPVAPANMVAPQS